MHATLKRDVEPGSEALFFADLPESGERHLIRDSGERCAYGAARKPNWPAILAILLIHIVTFYALVKFDVIQIKAKPKALVVDLIAEPPAPPAEQPKPEPVVVEKIEPVVITPPPIVQTLAPPPPPIAVTSTPPPPRPVTAAPAPPTGPVTVGDLNERLLEGRAPSYPIESRRKKEQGTVILRVQIGTDGRVQQISVAQSSGFERLDQAALKAARGWRWQPLVRDGQPVEIRGTLTFPFSLT